MWEFIRRATVPIVLNLFVAIGYAPSAGAVPVTYDITLTATKLGTTFGGISALPAGPFLGSFTIADPLAPNLNDSAIALTDFALTIGTEHWDLSDVFVSNFSTDAAGDIVGMLMSAANGSALVRLFEPTFNGFDWLAFNGASCLPGTEPESVSGPCIAGGVDTFVLAQQVEVPEPATLAIVCVGLSGMAWIARKR